MVINFYSLSTRVAERVGRKYYCYIFFIIVTSILSANETEIPADFKPKGGYLGVSAIYQEGEGLRIEQVVVGSPADSAGLQSADIIEKIDGIQVSSQTWFSYLIARNAPGDTICVDLIRLGSQLSLVVGLGNRADFQGEMSRGDRLEFRENSQIFPALHRRRDKHELRALTLLDSIDGWQEYDALQEAFIKESSDYGGYYKLDAVNFVLRDPLKAMGFQENLLQELSSHELSRIITVAGKMLDIPTADRINFSWGPPVDLSSTASVISTIIQESDQYLDQAFASLDSAEVVFILNYAPQLLDIFLTDFYLTERPQEESDSLIKVVNLTKQVNYSALWQAIDIVSFLQSTQFVSQLQSIMDTGNSWPTIEPALLPPSWQSAGDLVFFKSDSTGTIAIGGSGSNHYLQDATLILDLGGDDIYHNNCGGPVTVMEQGRLVEVSHSTAAIIDLTGNDLYIGNRPGSLASGLMGIGLILDLEGNDHYSGDQLVGGSALLGAGFLLDRAGDDRYLMQEMSLGCAFWGLGVLQDRSGNDLYSTTLYSQGFGGSKGFGLLHDVQGNDRYTALGKHPSGYGTRGIWSGWSQGVGCGFRRVSCGGIGILRDDSGQDWYEAGNFSQGVGYFFAIGALWDLDGNDHYIGSRYVQGCGVHQAVGALTDHRGNDYYSGKIAMNQGGAWDVGVATFLELSGDDIYTGDTYGQGGAAQNGFVYFLDETGDDQYICNTLRGQGWGGSNTYSAGRGAKSLVFMLDMKGRDSYTNPGRSDNTQIQDGELGIFRDME